MSQFTVTLLEESVDDIKLGKRFYEESEVGVDISSLRLYAGIHSTRFGYHRMLLKCFPFVVYYEKVGDEARVIAVLDMRQNPKSIRDILKNRTN
tara:strand:+ start:1059 stop:1340 length:282 start_codon:yes stop_codon:yes gene_type:complete